MGLLLFWKNRNPRVSYIDYSIKPVVSLFNIKSKLSNYLENSPQVKILNPTGSILVGKTSANTYFGSTNVIYNEAITYNEIGQIYGGNNSGIDLPPILYSIKNKVPRGKI